MNSEQTADAAVTPPADLTPPAGHGAGPATHRWRHAPAVTQPLTAIRLGQNAELVVLFTTDDRKVEVHYADYTDLRGYVRCAGPDCLLCQIGVRPDTRYLLPVYHTARAQVAVLPVPPNRGQGGLGPALGPYLDRILEGERLTVDVRKLPNNTYSVNALPGPAGDQVAAAIAGFLADFKAGRVALEDVYSAPSRAELFRVPEIARQARTRGIEA